jgi:nucleoside-diphosphate-sugar epimerase
MTFPEKVLITGVTGLIGRHLLTPLLERAQVWGVSRRSRPPLKHPNLEWVPCDITQPNFFRAFPRQIDAVIHLAQSSYFREFPDRAVNIFEVNLLSTFHLASWAKDSGCHTFVFASTGGIYGSGSRAFTETDPPRIQGPLSFYYTTKYCSELILQQFSTMMAVIILRPFFVYGPGQRVDSLINRLILSIKNGNPIFLQGETGMRFNPVHVKDVVNAVIRLIELRNSHIVNVAGQEVLTLRQIAEIIGDHLGIAPHFQVDRESQPQDLIGDIQKLISLVGAPLVRFSEGVREICSVPSI